SERWWYHPHLYVCHGGAIRERSSNVEERLWTVEAVVMGPRTQRDGCFMPFRDWVRGVIGAGSARKDKSNEVAFDADPQRFVYIKIPESISPFDRGAKYEDPLQGKLQKAKAGEVTGGGTQLGDLQPD